MSWKARARRDISALVLGSLAGLAGLQLMPTVQAAAVLPALSLTLPTSGATVSGIVLLQALADGPGVADLQFRVNGSPVGAPISSGSCSAEWNTVSSGDGNFSVTAVWHDEAGNTYTSNAATVTVSNSAPQISSVSATNLSDTSATIGWVTSQTATSQVEYGLTTSYGNMSPLDPTLVTNHALNLSGLAPGTTYNYRVRSINWQGALSVSGNNVFATGANGAPGSPPSPGGCVTPDPFANLGGGTCWNGGWLPPGVVPPNSSPAPAPAPAPTPAPAPPTSPPPPPGNCATPDPFLAMGGGTCWDGGWLPPGIAPPNSTPVPPAAPPVWPSTPAPSLPTPAPVPPSADECRTPNPFAAMGGGICWNGGWLPPGMVPPGWGSTPTPPTQTPLPPPVSSPGAPPSSGGCSGTDPFAAMGGGRCWNGGWLPPGVVPPGGFSSNPTPPAPAPPVSAPGTCVGPNPFATHPTMNGVCVNGGWIPIPRG